LGKGLIEPILKGAKKTEAQKEEGRVEGEEKEQGEGEGEKNTQSKEKDKIKTKE
jgi:hypothetical protein